MVEPLIQLFSWLTHLLTEDTLKLIDIVTTIVLMVEYIYVGICLFLSINAQLTENYRYALNLSLIKLFVL